GIRDLIVTGVQTCALPIYHRLGPAVPQDLAQPKIDRMQAIAVQRTGLDDLQELDDISTAERPPERRLVDDAGNIERKHLSAEALDRKSTRLNSSHDQISYA